MTGFCPSCKATWRCGADFCPRCGNPRSRPPAGAKPTLLPPQPGERLRALAFATHLGVIAFAVVVPGVPFCIHTLHHDWASGIVWGLVWWLGGVVTGATIEVWDGPPWPRLAVLWERWRSP